MIGLMFIIAGGVYLLLWVTVVLFSYRLTFRAKQSKSVALALAGMMCLVMYLIPFWDLIPTLITYKHHCETQAGFTVYKTPEQWDSENQGVLETLTPDGRYLSFDSPIGRGTQKNDRFGLINKKTYIGVFPVRESRSILIDLNTQEVIAEDINFRRGYSSIGLGGKGWWKFWLAASSCYTGSENVKHVKEVRNYYQKFKIGWN